ncbi:hypothetical protein JCM3770_007331 [Rhodotorula araucariae]
MFSSSGAGGAAAQPGPPSGVHPAHLSAHQQLQLQQQQLQQQQLYPQQQGYAAQQYQHHQPRTFSAAQPGPVGGDAPPPGSLPHGAGGPQIAYSGKQHFQGYAPPQPRAPGAGVPAGYASGQSPHMAPRNAPPPHQQQQQPAVRYSQPQQQLAPGQEAYAYPPPLPARSPAPPTQQDRYAASPTTYAPPQPIPSPHPHPGPSPHSHHQHIPSTSHPFPPPQQAQTYGPPNPAPQPMPSPSRSAQHFSPHPPAATAATYPPHSRQPSYLQPSSAPAPPAPHQGRGAERAAGSGFPPPEAYAPAVLPAHAQARAQALGEAQAHLEQRAMAELERRNRESSAFSHARMERRDDVMRGVHDAGPEGEVVPASRPLPRVGNGYVAAPVQPLMAMGSQPPRVSAQHEQARFVPPLELPDESEQRSQFHAYLLDYLQKAGFLSTAAALLADAPSIPTHPLSSGRSFAVPSSSSSSQPQSATSATFPHLAQQQQHNPVFFTSPSAVSLPSLGPAPPRAGDEHGSPHRRAGGSPVSPLSSHGGDGADGKNSADTVESTASTASTASTMSHFGFEALHGDSGDGASPAKGDAPRSPAKRTTGALPSSRHASGSSSGTSLAGANKDHLQKIPAARVQIDAPTGFLFEWWAVFWDVFRAQAAARQPGAAENVANARSFCQASSAAVEAAMMRRVDPGRAPPAPAPAAPVGSVPQRAAAPPPQMHESAYAASLPQTQQQMQVPMQMPPLPSPLAAPPIPLPPPSPVAPGGGGGGPARQPIPLRTLPLTGSAQPQPQRVGSVLPGRGAARRGALPPDALPEDALPSPDPAGGTRRASSTRSARAHHLAQQRQQEQQAELNTRLAQARIHAQQITHRQRSRTGSDAGATPEGAGAGMSPRGVGGASPYKPGATPPVSASSPSALNYRPDQLQQAAEARNAYRARLVASQQSQLEQAKRAVSSRRASASAAPTPTPALAGEEGSMPPPPAGKRGTLSMNNTPQGRELALGPSPGATGGAEQAHSPAGTGPAAAEGHALTPDGTGAPSGGKRRRDSLVGSVSETRETKKRATRSANRPPSAEGATPAPSGLPDVSEGVAGVSERDFAATPADSSATPTAPPPPAALPTEKDYSVSDDGGLDPRFAGAMEFDSQGMAFEPPGPDGLLSLEQLDALLSTTLDAAGSGYPPDVAVNDGGSGGGGGGGDASFNYEDFMTSFGNDGPASYDPTVQSFDLAV